MNNKIILAFIAHLLFLPSCFNTTKQHGNDHTFFIQAPLKLNILQEIQDTLSQKVDIILQEELGIKKNKNFPLYFPRKRPGTTLYYVSNLYDNNEPIQGLVYLFLDRTIDSLENPVAPKNTSLTSEVKFFGEPKEGLFALQDLVSVIDDSNNELFQLNAKIKTAVHLANEEYKRAYRIDLYDIRKSEKYPYLPHTTLGHLRENYIKHLLDNPKQSEKVIERIKQRIIETASEIIGSFTQEERKLSYNKITIYNLETKTYIKERTIE